MNVLMAYPYIRDFNGGYTALMTHLFGPRDAGWPGMMVDSGAFSVFRGMAHVTVPEYGTWLLDHQDQLDIYVTFDVIGDGPASMANLKELRTMGLDPMPVFHSGSDWRILDHYVETSGVVGLGGWAVAPHARGDWPAWAAHCFLRHPTARFHGFGMTKVDHILAFPWYSVDSSSWSAGYRYGRLRLWDGRRLRQLGIGGKAYEPDGVARNRWAQDLVRSYGYSPHAFYGEEYHYETAAAISVKAWERLVAHIRSQGRDEFRLYLADVNHHALRTAWETVRV